MFTDKYTNIFVVTVNFTMDGWNDRMARLFQLLSQMVAYWDQGTIQYHMHLETVYNDHLKSD